MTHNLKNVSWAFMLSLAVLVLPDMAHAFTPSSEALEGSLGGAICAIVNAMTGTVGKAIASLGVLILGIGAFFGKVNWGLAVLVAVGVAGIFGAKEIIKVFAGEEDVCPE